MASSPSPSPSSVLARRDRPPMTVIYGHVCVGRLRCAEEAAASPGSASASSSLPPRARSCYNGAAVLYRERATAQQCSEIALLGVSSYALLPTGSTRSVGNEPVAFFRDGVSPRSLPNRGCRRDVKGGIMHPSRAASSCRCAFSHWSNAAAHALSFVLLPMRTRADGLVWVSDVPQASGLRAYRRARSRLAYLVFRLFF